MRLFGRITHYLQISRCINYHAPLFRPRNLLQAKRLRQLCSNATSASKCAEKATASGCLRVQKYSQKGNNVFSISDNADMLRKRISFSGKSSNSPKILPIGLITPETGDGKDLKIVIVPLDLAGMDANALKETLETINQLRMYANHIETFSSSMVEEYNALNEALQEVEAQERMSEAMAEDRNLFENYPSLEATDVSAVGSTMNAGLGADSMPMQRQAAVTSCLQNAIGNSGASTSMKTSTKSMSALAQPEIIKNPSTRTADNKVVETEEGNFIEEVRVDVPQDLNNRLNDLAVASMELSFEMDMTSLQDAILTMGTNAVTKQDPMICMHSKVELDGQGVPEHTIPLRFNALISGVVEIDTQKLNLDVLSEDNIPVFNDDLTSLAANLCSTALEKGFSDSSKTPDTYIADLELTKDEEVYPSRIIDTSYMSAANQVGHQREALQRIAEEASIVPGTQEQEVPVPVDKDGCKHPPVPPKRKCPGKCPLITDPCKEDPCERPEKKKAPKKKAVKITEITSMAKDKDPCGKKEDPCAKKEDPCAKKEDPCAKKKDPCAKKEDPCAKKEDPCAKKEDPCAKKEDPCAKKEDPCAKKEDPCAKKEDPCAKKKDPCAKDGKDKKKDPCAQFKSGEKKDPCAKDDKKKKDPCAKDKKKDPCAKDKKKDPCAKDKKKDPCAKDDKKKKDPCAKDDKKKKDPCAKDKKKDPCAKNGKGGKDEKKKDPCAKFKKGGKDGKDKCAKFSTFSRRSDPIKRYLSTALNQALRESDSVPSRPRFTVHSALVRRHHRLPVPKTGESCQCSLCQGCLGDNKVAPPRFTMNATLLRRRFGSLTRKISPNALTNVNWRGKKSKKGGKCGQLETKFPKNRGKDTKERTGIREDCFSDDDGGCGVKSCTGKCAKVKFPKKKCERDEKKDKDE